MRRRLGALVALFSLAALAGCRSAATEPHTTGKKMTADLNVVQLLGELGPRYAEPGKPALMPKDDAVRVLTEFRDAEPFTAVPAAGEELWFGKTYDVTADTHSFEGYLFCRIKAGAPPLAFATGLVTDGWQEEGDAANIFQELKTGQPVKPSHGYHYMMSTAPEGGYAPLVRSDGKSSVIQAASPRWIRQSGARMLLVERLPGSPTTHFNGAGHYAELWRVGPRP
jgi:hypothetical protein